jgi:hypothetical protein
MAKPSNAQHGILTRLARGSYIVSSGYFAATLYTGKHLYELSVPRPTLEAMVRNGWVAEAERPANVSDAKAWRITAAGCAAVGLPAAPSPAPLSSPTPGDGDEGESLLRDEDVEREKPKQERGLFRKYNVERTDGSSAPGGKHHGCEYFVLDLSHDPFAPPALRAYAAACAAEYPALAADLRTIAAVAPVPAKVEAAHSLEDWHEDQGPVLWWAFPIAEPPYAGTPLDSSWPGYHTHWTHFHVPDLALPPETSNG